MSQTRPFIVVLWGNQFDEAVAAIFVTQLRQAGLQVKVVGLHGPTSRGANGLALSADMTLGEAIEQAEDVTCVVIPAEANAMKRAMQDPRVEGFLTKATEHQAQTVASVMALKKSGQIGISNELQVGNSLRYPDTERLSEFVQEIVDASICRSALTKGLAHRKRLS